MRSVIAIVAMLAIGAPCAPAQSPDGLGCPLEPGPTRSVVEVRGDGTVALDDRSVVRLTGLLIPSEREAGDASRESQAALAGLVSGKSVALAFAGPRSDRWGRVQAHLFVIERDGGMVWLQGRLVEDGHARVFAPPGGEACVETLLEREASARQESRGLWRHAAFQVRPADRPSELARFSGTFQLVHGRLDQAGGARTLVLRFASAEAPGVAGRERGFRAVVKAPAALAALGTPRALIGRDVLVRGWIEARSGPEIEVVAAGQVTVVGPPPQRSRRRTAPASGEPPEAMQKRPADEPPGAQK